MSLPCLYARKSIGKKINNRTKILFLHSSADLYGSDKSLLRIVSGLDPKVFEAYVLLPCPGPLVESLKQAGIFVRILPLAVMRRRYANAWGMAKWFFQAAWAVPTLVWFVRMRRISLVQSNTLAVILGGVVARLAGVPHVWYAREILEEPAYVKRILVFLMMHFSTKVLAVSKAVRLHWTTVGPRLAGKMEVLPNGLGEIEGHDPKQNLGTHSRFEKLNRGMSPNFGSCPSISRPAARKKLNLPGDGVLVGMLGRINRMKGHAMLLEVAKGLVKKYPELRFVCFGDPPPGEAWRHQELLEKISQDGLQENFILREFISEVGTFYDAMDIVAVPSTAPDALPTVCLEAGFLGKPVVGFDVGGIGEIIQDGQTGFCIARGDIAGFRLALEDLIKDSRLREKMGKCAKAYCQEHFSLSRQIDRLQEIIAEVLP